MMNVLPATCGQDSFNSVNRHSVFSDEEHDVTQLRHGDDVLETVAQAARVAKQHHLPLNARWPAGGAAFVVKNRRSRIIGIVTRAGI